jgi:hypothetical protein
MHLKHIFSAITFLATTLDPSPVFAVNTDPATICRHYAKRIPNVKPAQCTASQLQASAGRSVKGRIIWTRDIAPTNPNLRVLVVGGIHGDELSSVSIVFHWLDLAMQPPADTPQAVHWRFIPALNPDGIFSSRSKRMNASGVDLNRNFPTPNWARDSRLYWEQRTKKDPRRWPGPSAMSEPETKFLHEQIDSFKPNLIVSVHAPFGLLDFDGPFVPPSKLGRLYLDQLGIFPGSLGNYAGVHKGVPVVTVELPSATRTPSEAEMRQMWLALLRWMGAKLKPAAA